MLKLELSGNSTKIPLSYSFLSTFSHCHLASAPIVKESGRERESARTRVINIEPVYQIQWLTA